MRTKLTRLILVLGLFFSLGFNFSLGFKEVDSALEKAFPGAQIEVKNVVLTNEQVEKAEALSGVRLTTRLVSFYIAKKNNKTIGYAYIDSHIVRAHPETVLYIINPNGEIEHIQILHSDEPVEYRAGENWLKLFKGKALDRDRLRLRRDISAITGATISSRAITDNTRKALAVWKVVFGKK